MVQDGAGDEVAEEGDEQAVVEQPAVLGDAGLAVDQVAELGEGEKRDAEREQNAAGIDVVVEADLIERP